MARGGIRVRVWSCWLERMIEFPRSKDGLIAALEEYYGQGLYSLRINPEDGIATLRVPQIDLAGWIGERGRIVSTLSSILEVSRVKIVGISLN